MINLKKWQRLKFEEKSNLLFLIVIEFPVIILNTWIYMQLHNRFCIDAEKDKYFYVVNSSRMITKHVCKLTMTKIDANKQLHRNRPKIGMCHTAALSNFK